MSKNSTSELGPRSTRGGLAGLALSMACGVAFSAWLATPAVATWSVVAVDTETLEVAIGSATCVTGIDLKAFSPALIVGKGGGAAQSQVDGSGVRRQTMRAGFLAGTSSDDIMTQLVALSGSSFHQNGVATLLGDSATFSGATTLAHSSGVIGSVGSLHYAVQGNILTGSPVVTMAESALVNTVGDLPAKLMAAMEAARSMGGDGRCSCPGNPTGCGSPPPSFTKSADVGFMLLARYGDTDDSNCNASGCADGDYFMSFNVANQSSGDPDPVAQLQGLFDGWRFSLEDNPDALATSVDFIAESSDYRLRVELFDWRGFSAGSPGTSVLVEHHQDSTGSAAIGPVVDQGGGVYEVLLTGGAGGTDIFLITIDDGGRPVVIPPTRTVLPDALVFADGFEDGDTSGWPLGNRPFG